MGAGDRSLNYQELNTLTNEKLLPRDLCLLAGRQFQISEYGILGYAMKSAQTLSQALHLASKYHQTAAPLLSVDFAVNDDLYEVILENTSLLDEGVFALLVEELMATFPRVIYQLTGEDILAEKIDLSYADTDHLQSYQEVFNCLPTFNASRCVYAIWTGCWQRIRRITARRCRWMCGRFMRLFCARKRVVGGWEFRRG